MTNLSPLWQVWRVGTRWAPEWPLPARAFVPGRGASRPEVSGPEPADHPADEWRLDRAYLYGVDLFEGGFPWEAHEVWEGAWKSASDPARRELLQGLIQCAAAVVKAGAGAPAGVRSLAARGTGRLEAAARAAGSPLMGLDVPRFAGAFRQWASTPEPSFADRPRPALVARSRDLPASLTDHNISSDTTDLDEGDGFLAIRTPSRPGFRDGNALLLDAPPRPDEIEARFEDARRAVGEHSGRPLSLVWEREGAGAGAADDVEEIAVLCASSPPERAPPPPGVTLRRLDERDVDDLVWLATAVHSPNDASRAEFWRWRTSELMRALADHGGGFWGAFRGRALIGSLGLSESPTLFRFQEVITHPEERGRGVATSLAALSLASAFARHPRATAIIVADPGSQRERIYRRLGFRSAGRQYWLRRWA